MLRLLPPDPCHPAFTRRRAAAALLALAALPAARQARAAAATGVELEREGNRFVVSARAELDTDVRTAWDTLTDYGRLPEFIPGLTRTRVLSRLAGGHAAGTGERLTVEYHGRFAMLFMHMPTRLWLDVQHVPYTEILARSAPALPAGAEAPTLRAFRGRYGLTPAAGGDAAAASRLRLDYSAQFDLAEPLPPVIGALFGATAMRHAVHEQFSAMVAEITRRARLRDADARGD